MSNQADIANKVDVLVQPVVLRFALVGDEIAYFFAGHADGQLDAMERHFGIDPAEQMLFDANLGFLPVSTTVLIRGERTIVVDPGNHHVGFYGQLGVALRRFGLTVGDVDLVVCTHCHHDHMASVFRFPGVELVLGEGEAEFSKVLYGPEEAGARLAVVGALTEVPLGGELQLCAGVRAVSTPGHTPGHISVVADTATERIVITGDAAMTRSEYMGRAFSHWYTDDQLRELNASVDRMAAFSPTLVMPGHDRAFAPGPVPPVPIPEEVS